MKKLITIIFFLGLGLSNVYSMQPDVFVQSTVNRASEILSKNISKEEKTNGLKIIDKEKKLFKIYLLSANKNLKLSLRQINKYKPNFFIVSKETSPQVQSAFCLRGATKTADL